MSRIVFEKSKCLTFSINDISHNIMATIPANLSISIPTLTGSVLSCVASFFALCLHVIVPPPRRHFRHALIVNLLVAGRSINSIRRMRLPNSKRRLHQQSQQYSVRYPRHQGWLRGSESVPEHWLRRQCLGWSILGTGNRLQHSHHLCFGTASGSATTNS